MKFRKITKFLLIFPLALVFGVFFANDFALAEDCLIIDETTVNGSVYNTGNQITVEPGDNIVIKAVIKNNSVNSYTYASKVFLDNLSNTFSQISPLSLLINLQSSAGTDGCASDVTQAIQFKSAGGEMVFDYKKAYLQYESSGQCLLSENEILSNGALISNAEDYYKNGACNLDGLIYNFFSSYNYHQNNLYIELTAQCADGYENINGSCIYQCANPLTEPNAENNGCQCIDGYENINGSCVYQCANPLTEPNAENNGCQCIDGYENIDGVCMAKCRADQVRNPTTDECECPSGEEEVSGSCVAKCGTNEERDVYGDCQCIDGTMIYNNACQTCSVVPYYMANPSNPAQCVPCSSVYGYTNSCVQCDTANHFVVSADKNSCVCASGYDSWNGSCLLECDTNEVRNGSGVCVCDYGYELVNGSCVSVCGANKVRNATTGFCECDADNGYVADGSGGCELDEYNAIFTLTSSQEMPGAEVLVCSSSNYTDCITGTTNSSGYTVFDTVPISSVFSNCYLASYNKALNCPVTHGDSFAIYYKVSKDGYGDAEGFKTASNVQADLNFTGTVATLGNCLTGYQDFDDGNGCVACENVPGYDANCNCDNSNNYVDDGAGSCKLCNINEHKIPNADFTDCICNAENGYVDSNNDGVCELDTYNVSFKFNVKTSSSAPIENAKFSTCLSADHASCTEIGTTNASGQMEFSSAIAGCSLADENTSLNCPVTHGENLNIYYKVSKTGYQEVKESSLNSVVVNNIDLTSKVVTLGTCATNYKKDADEYCVICGAGDGPTEGCCLDQQIFYGGSCQTCTDLTGYILEAGACACNSVEHFISDGAGACTCDADNHFISDGSTGCVCDSANYFVNDGTGNCICDSTHKDPDNSGACVVCDEGDGPEQGCCSEGQIFSAGECFSAKNDFKLYIKVAEHDGTAYTDKVADIEVQACKSDANGVCASEYYSLGTSTADDVNSNFNFIDSNFTALFDPDWNCTIITSHPAHIACTMPRGETLNLTFKALPSAIYTPYEIKMPIISWQSGLDIGDSWQAVKVKKMEVCPIEILDPVVDRENSLIKWYWGYTTTNDCIEANEFEFSLDSSEYQPFDGSDLLKIDFDCNDHDLQIKGIYEDKYAESNVSNYVPNCGCGNGFIDEYEQCDDGDIVSGDGCSSACQFEPVMCADLIGDTSLPTTNYMRVNDVVRTCQEWDTTNNICSSWDNSPDDDPAEWTYDDSDTPRPCSFACSLGFTHDYDENDNHICTSAEPECGNGITEAGEVCDKGENDEYIDLCGNDCTGGLDSFDCNNYQTDGLNIELVSDDVVSVKCLAVDDVNNPTYCTQKADPSVVFSDYGSSCAPNTCCFNCTSSDYQINGETCEYVAPDEEDDAEEEFFVSNPNEGAVATWSNTKGGTVAYLWTAINDKINEVGEKAFQSISRIGNGEMQALEMRFRIYVGDENLGGYEQDKCDDNGFCQNLVRWKLSGLDPNTGEKISLYSTEECLYQSGSTVCLQDFMNGVVEDGYITVSVLSPEGIDNENNRRAMINFLTDNGGLVYPQLEFAFGETPEWAGIHFPKIMYQLRFGLLGAVSDYDEDIVTVPDEYITITSEGTSQGTKQSVEVKIAPKKILPIFDYAIFQD